VLDASALIALMYQESGSAVVEQAIDEGAAISTVNVAEVAAKLNDAGMDDDAVREALDALDIEVHTFDRVQAYRSGLMRAQTKSSGLSLGDRACLALAAELGLPAVTADRAWAGLAVGVTIRVIR
jgi:PIN domain nuclease of toxin-antitoxin system